MAKKARKRTQRILAAGDAVPRMSTAPSIPVRTAKIRKYDVRFSTVLSPRSYWRLVEYMIRPWGGLTIPATPSSRGQNHVE
ncbi:MAG TPA: hypothetical protein PKM41_02380 [Deltaproteobacteria bacterium]|nr:hypothetical protein [Deltaproteobacteria bacterium]